MVRHQFRRFPPFQDNQEVQVHDLLTNQASVPEQDTVHRAGSITRPSARGTLYTWSENRESGDQPSGDVSNPDADQCIWTAHRVLFLLPFYTYIWKWSIRAFFPSRPTFYIRA